MDRLINLNNNKFFNDYTNHPIPVVAELIITEEEYVKVLEKVVCGYISEYYNETSEIPKPELLEQYDGLMIFSNIAEIYQWHKHFFLEALRENQHSVRGLSEIFTQNEHHFHMYAKFSLNKSISEYLISTNLAYFEIVRKKLKHKNNIEDLMIAPVQRVIRYEMLLRVFLKYLNKNGLLEDIEYLNKACDMLKVQKSFILMPFSFPKKMLPVFKLPGVCNEVDEFTALNGIKNFDGLISSQGKLLLHGFLKCVYNGKHSDFYVFIFKCSIVFTEKQGPKRKFLNPSYNFCMQIPMNKLHLKELTNSKFSLQLRDPHVPECIVICQAHTKEEHKKWLSVIKKQLALQMNLIHDLVHPNTSDQREVLL